MGKEQTLQREDSKEGSREGRKALFEVYQYIEVHVRKGRTGWPPIRDTAASVMSAGSSMKPSGTPRRTFVSTPASSSSSSSDQSGMDLGERM